MAKKRGGIAGFYDRNKKIIKPVATGLAGMFGTPALGAAVGAAFGGLDRPGKSGIGLDVMGAAKGGLSGYAAGSAGQSLGKMAGIPKIGGLQSAGTKLSGLFTGGGKAASVSPVDKLTGAPKVGLTAGGPSSYGTMGSYQPTLAGAASMPPTAAMASAAPADAYQFTDGKGMSLGSLFGKEGMIEQNKTLLSGIGKGIMGIRNDALDQQAADATLNQRKYEFDKTYGIDAAQEADRKRRENELMAQRAAFRAMFTGTA